MEKKEEQQQQESNFMQEVNKKCIELSQLISDNKKRGYIVLAYDETDMVKACVEGDGSELIKSVASAVSNDESPFRAIVIRGITLWQVNERINAQK